MTTPTPTPQITVGELATRFLEQCGVKAAFGVISIHNMPILDAFHRRQKIRFVSARGEAGACNMADAYARVSRSLVIVKDHIAKGRFFTENEMDEKVNVCVLSAETACKTLLFAQRSYS